MFGLATIELRRFSGAVPELGKNGPGGGEEAVLASGGGEFRQARPEDEATLDIARDEPVVFERDREPVSRRPGEPGCAHESCERCGPRFKRAEYRGGFVDHTDAASLFDLNVHGIRLSSRDVKCECFATAPSRNLVPTSRALHAKERRGETTIEESLTWRELSRKRFGRTT